MNFPYKLLSEAFEYGSHIIFETNSFLEFAISLVDYIGEEIIPYCKMVYNVVCTLSDSQNLKFEDCTKIHNITPEVLRERYHAFKNEQESRNRRDEFKDNIDELQFLVKTYRNSNEFKELLDFVGRFNYLAPFNAMLVHLQKPGAKFVFNGKKWFEFGRQPKVNAQNIIILVPFGPIQCVFDYSDTIPIPGGLEALEIVDLMDKYDKGLLQAKGKLADNILENLIHNLPNYGIYLDDTFQASNTFGGYIMSCSDQKLTLSVNSKSIIKWPSKFIISVNRNQTDAVKFHTICHELGHLFCFHLSYNSSKKRSLSVKEREFEAETVAWLVCKRNGIENPSEEYLAGYAPTGEIPICSTDLIMRAVTEIEKMLQGPVYLKDSLWFKEDKKFKSSIVSFLS